MRTRTTLAVATVLAAGALLGWLAASGRLAGPTFAQDTGETAKVDGTQLPTSDCEVESKLGETYKDATPSYPQPVKAPKRAPNLLLALLDAVGFGMCSTVGGPVPTPHMQK